MLKHVEITNKHGKTLRGYLDYPENFNGLLVIMYHGFTGNKTEHGGHFRDFSRLLSKHDIGSIRVDYSGNGESDGTFKDFTYDTLLSDANIILDYSKTLDNVNKICLLGFSMGGHVASYIASERSEEVDNLLLWSPSGNMLEVIKNIYEKYPKLENGNADFPNFEISKEMYESASKYKMYDRLDRFNKDVYIVHGKKDKAVDYLYGIKYQESFPNSKIYLIETAGHGYDNREDKKELFTQSLDFLKRLIK